MIQLEEIYVVTMLLQGTDENWGTQSIHWHDYVSCIISMTLFYDPGVLFLPLCWMRAVSDEVKLQDLCMKWGWVRVTTNRT